ncbi:hypothetical protein ACFSO9_14960 [Mesonia maritima]|uniref:hypothetical protein n=1 Tax=Mesonia maritima TaxID=1793873 RepID=UPI0036441620
MKFRKILLVVTLLVGFTGLAQKEKPSLKIKQKYQEYFSLDREAFFLHLNKNVFIPGEDIWFSAYAFNPKRNTPNFETTNLYVKLLDENLKPYSTKTIFINKGKGSGYFKLDTLPAGSYRLVAHTNYMKNFSEDYYYNAEFTILQKDSVEINMRVIKMLSTIFNYCPKADI